MLNSTPETEYLASVAPSHRKRLGQFFTPPQVAQFMTDWIIRNPSCHTILDPALGLGIFLRAILAHPEGQNYQLFGYDIDPVVLEHADTLFANHPNVQLIQQDYLFNDWATRYDGIICNPPYLKFQHYSKRTASLQELQTRLDITLSGLTNMYSMFLLKSVHQLAKNGRAAYLVPSEFLNADYGTIIKHYLLASHTLRYVILFDSASTIFTDALTTSCILLLANDEYSQHVTFVDARSVDDLAHLQEQLQAYPQVKMTGRTIPMADLDPQVKWRTYYQKQHPRPAKYVVPLSTYGKIVRGIATGNNDFFTFDLNKQREFGIPDEYLLPCISKAQQANTNFFTPADYARLRDQGKRVLLLNAREPLPPAVQDYLELGEQQGVNQRYLTSQRTPWFALEQRPPAPILVTVFNRNGLRFVRNEAEVWNLTCFHNFYVNLLALPRLELLMAYLLTDVAKQLFNAERRDYGGGLAKFEPNDLNRASMIDLDVIDSTTEKIIKSLYHAYRGSILHQQPRLDLLEELNDLFVQFL